ncbi:MAG: hypothetical protein H6621_03860 [Halobacteriovoraceae bacterium]|nr:hypothetical protein [Halobacteriovoraceae bacterium]MCB9094184.1 hypothetical protein [Halobacteriovoraceae bacterium]
MINFFSNIKVKKVFNTLTILLILTLSSFFLFNFLPLEDVFSKNPATGGDTGSHFWPVKILAEYGLPQLKVHLWNPGNLGGEPLFFHYFPLPFIIMAILGMIIPLGMAFNLGTLFGLIFLPISTYFCVRSFKLQKPTALLAAMVSLIFIYNEDFSMFGGNTLSTLAGQFSHGYALCFFLIGTGFYIRGVQKDQFSFWGIIFFTCTAFSHAYLFIIIPVVFLAALLSYQKPLSFWLKNALYGLAILLLSSWFIFPMLLNQAWMSPTPMTFGARYFEKLLHAPLIQYFLYLSLIPLAYFIFKQFKKREKDFYRNLLFWSLLLISYVGLYFIFPKIGLVDTRALPQILLFSLIILSFFWGYLLKEIKNSYALNLIIIGIFAGLLISIQKNVHQFPGWSKWNYSSWKKKPLYPALLNLSEDLRGSLADPRVAFEQSDINNGTGTIRVFEMLPYFANRATSESLYTQATVYSPYAFDIQALISKTPSCPFGLIYSCPTADLLNIENKLDLLGIDSLILVSEKIIDEARLNHALKEVSKSGPWTVFKLTEKIEMSRTLNGAKLDIRMIDANWKRESMEWFKARNQFDDFLVFALDQSQKEQIEKRYHYSQTLPVHECASQVDSVDFSGFDFSTNCPGQPHLIKYAYHPTWKLSSLDPYFLISPGMLLVFPSTHHIRFEFAKHYVLDLSTNLSLLCFIILIILKKKKRLA